MLADDLVAKRRGDAIARLGLLSRVADPGLTGLCRIAAYVTGAGASAVHILDDVAQHRVAAVNAPLVSHPRPDSMCRLVVDGAQRIVCADSTLDERFGYTSFVRGDAPVRFYASFPLRSSDGSVVGSLCAFDTVARELSDEQAMLMEDLADHLSTQIELTHVATELGQIASHDPLTGAVNRLLLAARFAQAFARRLRSGGRTLLAVVDLDSFKQFNDTHGHAAGDEILIAVAKRLQDTVRSQDTVARIGGDEFVVLAETERDDEEARLRERLEGALAKPITAGGRPDAVTASIGCVYAEPGESIRSALARADAAMYAVKPHVAH